ncbi:MAG: tetratricopeptide repeat protein [Deltaproteobacteria bacterium]|nr:tetratricopeptide repeat protein [Deltaproteobacteria bacterium]
MIHLRPILAVYLIIIVLPGCFYPNNINRPRLKPTAQTSEFNKKYYNFTSAQVELKKGNIDQAIYHMKEALKIDPESLYLKRELAFLYAEKKDYNSALDVFSSITEKDPNNVEALIMLGKIKQGQKAYEDAILAYSKVIALDAKQHDIYLLLGGLYIEKSEPSKALDVFNQMIQHFPDFYTAYYFLGKIYMEQGNVTQAEKQFKKTLKLNADLLEPKFELANLYQTEKFKIYTVKPSDTLKKIAVRFYKKYNKGIERRILSLNHGIKSPDRIKAGQKLRMPLTLLHPKKVKFSSKKKNKIIQLYMDILADEPKNIRATMELGYFYDKMNMKPDAAKLYIELGKRSKDEVAVVIKLFNQYLDKNQFDATIAIAEGALKGAPNNSDLHHIAGLAYAGIENKEKALVHFNQVSEGTRFYEDSVVHTSYIYQQDNQTDQAIAYLKNIIDKHPDNAEFMLFLGSLYEDIESYDQAEKILKKGLSIDKKNVKLHFRLGVVYDKWDKKPECIDSLKRVIAIDPKHANALNYLGYTYAELGKNLDEAERLILEALKFKPNDGYITDSLGWVYYKKGLFKKAIEILEKAVSLVPDDPTMLEHLGDAHFKLNNKPDALKFYKLSLKNKNEKENSKETLEQKIKDLTDQGF